MKTTMMTLLLLSLALTGCVVAPGPGYGGPGYGGVVYGGPAYIGPGYYVGGHPGYYGEHSYYR